MRERHDAPHVSAARGAKAAHPPAAVPGPAHVPDEVAFDRDINVRGIVLTAVGLVVLTVLACLITWWLFVGVAKLEKRQDRPLSPLPEASRRVLPPEPRLQSDPDVDMEELRKAEERILEQPAWIDRASGRVRLPIDLAMDVLARRGLPAVTGQAPANASAPAQPPAPQRPPGGQP